MITKIRFLALGFFMLVLWAIYQANTGAEGLLVQVIRSLPYGDKVGHFGLFGTLTLLVNLALNHARVYCGKLPLLVGSVLVLSFVAIEESSQGLIPARNMDVWDFIADCAGIAVFSVIGVKLFDRDANSEEVSAITR